MKIENITGPVYWASYLVNNDVSGINAAERVRVDSWLIRNGVKNVLSIMEDSERFTWHNRLYDPSGPEGGEVCEYVCEVR